MLKGCCRRKELLFLVLVCFLFSCFCSVWGPVACRTPSGTSKEGVSQQVHWSPCRLPSMSWCTSWQLPNKSRHTQWGAFLTSFVDNALLSSPGLQWVAAAPSPTKSESQPCNGNFKICSFVGSSASVLEVVAAPIAAISVSLRAFFTLSN